MNVSWAEAKKDADTGVKAVYVSNVQQGTQADELRAIFAQYGEVSGCKCIGCLRQTALAQAPCRQRSWPYIHSPYIHSPCSNLISQHNTTRNRTHRLRR